MADINVSRVTVLDNPSTFEAPFAFEIEYECLRQLEDDLEWKMVYVGSAESEKYDQVLDSVLVGPVYAGNYRFRFEGDAPDISKLEPDDVVGVTVILLTCSYKTQEFLRIGYYVNNAYQDEELPENPPAVPDVSKLTRHILAEHPRVTRFPVEFDKASLESIPVAGEGGDIQDGDLQPMEMQADA
ncbi:histone chaperone [Haematococcus lacustris]